MILLCKSKTNFTHLDNATKNISSWPTWKKEFAGLNDNNDEKQKKYKVHDNSEVITYNLPEKQK